VAVIAHLTYDPDTGTYRGTLRTLTINTTVAIVPNKHKHAARQPDYRVLAQNGFELGAGWLKTSERRGSTFISCGLTAPEWGGRLYANIAPATDKGCNPRTNLESAGGIASGFALCVVAEDERRHLKRMRGYPRFRELLLHRPNGRLLQRTILVFLPASVIKPLHLSIRA
jgi:uncharacterized protein (DUF736 family)